MTMIGMSKTWLHKDAESDQQIKEFIPFPFVFFLRCCMFFQKLKQVSPMVSHVLTSASQEIGKPVKEALASCTVQDGQLDVSSRV